MRRAIVVVGMLNFLAFGIVAGFLGGDAFNGKVEEGHYYLYGVRTQSGHKVYTEVSKPVFTYSRWHVYSIMVTWPLVMAAAFLENRAKRHSKLM